MAGWITGRVTYPVDFERFWDVYPSRPGNPKQPAFKAWQKAIKQVAADHIIAAAVAYARAMSTKAPEYVCHASTWLNQARWADWEPQEAKQALDTEAIRQEQARWLKIKAGMEQCGSYGGKFYNLGKVDAALRRCEERLCGRQ